MIANVQDIKLKYAQRFVELSDRGYLQNTPKNKILADKQQLESDIAISTGPLLAISKLTSEDFDFRVHRKITASLFSLEKDKNTKSIRKNRLAKVKKYVLGLYRNSKDTCNTSFLLKKLAKKLTVDQLPNLDS